MTLRLVLLSLMLPALSGCASVFSTYFNREIQENEIDPMKKSGTQASVMGMTATRRGIVVRSTSPEERAQGRPYMLFCAEPPPDVAQSIASALELKLARTDVGEASISDTYKTMIENISTRTPLSETYRTAVYSICQLHLNGAISNAEAHELFKQVTTDVIHGLTAAAGKEPIRGNPDQTAKENPLAAAKPAEAAKPAPPKKPEEATKPTPGTD